MPKAPNKSRGIPFKTIRAKAEKRKGGPKELEKLLPRNLTSRRWRKFPTTVSFPR